ncbi:ribosomal protein S18-alanine N-acetyltransferase [Acidomonas methanolica]|nr:ribosomal protein S18-alanine N-acetyltransferase [Acidomonas methanolica]
MVAGEPALLPVLAALHAAAFAGGEIWDEAALAALLGMDGVETLLAVTEERRALGFLMARAVYDEAELLTLGVEPEARRRGVARALVAGLAARLAARGVRRLFLEVASRNDAARRLYEAAGFQPCGMRRRYYADGDDALVLALDLRMVRS